MSLNYSLSIENVIATNISSVGDLNLDPDGGDVILASGIGLSYGGGTAFLSSTGVVTNVTDLTVDNINANGNTITTTNDGNLILDANSNRYVEFGTGLSLWSNTSNPTLNLANGLVYYNSTSGVIRAYIGGSWEDITTTATAGDVTGPGSSTLNAIPTFSDTTGKVLQDTTLVYSSSTLNINSASGVLQINSNPILTLSTGTLGSSITTSSLTTVGALASGSIASGFGTISTTNGITTTGTLTGGLLTIDNINIDGNTILSTDLNGNVEVNPNGTGNFNLVSGGIQLAGTTVLSGTTLGSTIVTSSLTSVGTLDSGAISSNFGAINIGTSAFTGGSLDVDNINVDGNTISSTDTNGNITLAPNGTGDIVLTTGSGTANYNFLTIQNTVGADTGIFINTGAASWYTYVANGTTAYFIRNFSGTDIFRLQTGGRLSVLQEGIDIQSSSSYYIGANAVLSPGVLGSTIVTSSLTTVGALASGSIASGFGSISTTSTIATTSSITGGSLVADNITLDGNTLSITNTNGSITISPDQTSATEYLKGTTTIQGNVLLEGEKLLRLREDAYFSGTQDIFGLHYAIETGTPNKYGVRVVTNTPTVNTFFSVGSYTGNDRIGGTWTEDFAVRINTSGVASMDMDGSTLFSSNTTLGSSVVNAAITTNTANLNLQTSSLPTLRLEDTTNVDYVDIQYNGSTDAINFLDNGASTMFTIGSTFITAAGPRYMNVASGQDYRINTTSVLSATTLGSGVVTSSLTTVGALNSGSISSGFGNVDIGTSTFTGGLLDIDNITLDGNTISSTDTNGNITLAPNGTGSVILTSANAGSNYSFLTVQNTNGTGDTGVFLDSGATNASWYMFPSTNGGFYMRNYASTDMFRLTSAGDLSILQGGLDIASGSSYSINGTNITSTTETLTNKTINGNDNKVLSHVQYEATTTSTTSTTDVSTGIFIIYRGTNNTAPISTVSLYALVTAGTGTYTLFDRTNSNNQIFSTTTTGTGAYNIVTTTSISNLPTGPAIFELMFKNSGAGTTNCYDMVVN